ncbi:MAG: M48 family metalloprotease [Candidatus Methylomirabilales bacterium]
MILWLALTAVGCGPTLKEVAVSEELVQAEAEKQREIAFAVSMRRQDRLSKVSYPLLVAAAELCEDDATPIYGFTLHDIELYEETHGEEYEQAAARYYGIGKEVTVRYVHPDLPAATAGLIVGDRVLAINDQPVEEDDAAEVMEIIEELDLSEDQPLQLRIERDALANDVAIHGVIGCNYSVRLVNDDSVNAHAYGRTVSVTSGMIRFAETDEELALVVGHELAHNALDHITKQIGNVLLGTLIDILIAATTGVNTQGTFGAVVARAFSPGFEREADYAGLYIVARAGYDITDAANFWRRMAIEHPGSIEKNFLATHPSTPERFVAIENIVAEIEAKQLLGKVLLPEEKDQETQVPEDVEASTSEGLFNPVLDD